MSLQTFKEFFLSRLLTCPNFSFGSCRATVCKRRREIIGAEVCLAIGRQENIPPAADNTTLCKMLKPIQIPDNFFLYQKLSWDFIVYCRSQPYQLWFLELSFANCLQLSLKMKFNRWQIKRRKLLQYWLGKRVDLGEGKIGFRGLVIKRLRENSKTLRRLSEDN